MNSQFTAEEIRKGISEGTIQLFLKTNGVLECWKYFGEAKKDEKIRFGWAVCESCFTSILYKAKNGDHTKFYGTKNLSDHLKNCRRTPSSPSINNYFKSKQGNIKIQQSDRLDERKFAENKLERHYSAFNARHIITQIRNRLCPDVVEAVSINLESHKNSLL